jgi:hypothetical protein
MSPPILYWTALKVDPVIFDIFTKYAPRLLDPTIEVDIIKGFTASDLYDDDTFTVSKDDEGFRYCRTKTGAFFKNTVRCLIYMVELGMASEIRSNDDINFNLALDDVNRVITLNSYHEQQKYFMNLDPSDF